MAVAWLLEPGEGLQWKRAYIRSSGGRVAPQYMMRIRHLPCFSITIWKTAGVIYILQELPHNSLPDGKTYDLAELVWNFG